MLLLDQQRQQRRQHQHNGRGRRRRVHPLNLKGPGGFRGSKQVEMVANVTHDARSGMRAYHIWVKRVM